MKTAGKWLDDDRDGFKLKSPCHLDWSEGENSKRTLNTATTEEMSNNSIAENCWAMNSMAPCDGFGAMNDSFLVDDGNWWNDDVDLLSESKPVDSCASLVHEDDQFFATKKHTKSPSRKHKPDTARRRVPVDAPSIGSSDSKSKSSHDAKKRSHHKSKRSSREPRSPKPSRDEHSSHSRRAGYHRSSSCHSFQREPVRSRESRRRHDESPSDSMLDFLGHKSRNSSESRRSKDRPASPRKSRSYPESPKRPDKKDRLSSRRFDKDIEPRSLPSRSTSSKGDSKSSRHTRIRSEDPPESATGRTRPSRTRKHVSRRQSMDQVVAPTATESAPPTARRGRGRRASLY